MNPSATAKNRCARTLAWIVGAALVFYASSGASAQGPQGDSGSSGAAGGMSNLGSPLGAANFPDFGSPSSAPVSGGAGRARSHIPISSQAIPAAPSFPANAKKTYEISAVQPIDIPSYGDLAVPAEKDFYGSVEHGITLDQAIDKLVKENLDLYALSLEIPMAEADVLTAGLRANPIFYADTQLIPYGHFSFLRPGGPPQSDININMPIDVTRKRRARTVSAKAAKKVSEAQLQDAVRNQIDNLYTVYVDVVAAGFTLEMSRTYDAGVHRLLEIYEERLEEGRIKASDVSTIRANHLKAEMQVREAEQAKIRANQALALILNMNLDDVDKIDVRDPIYQIRPLPAPKNELVRRALERRPDLVAWRLAIDRAGADVRLAKANAYPDVYVLYQPYTLQNNTYLGVPSAYSWTLGATATIPAFNRNQGNIIRAKYNVQQTQVQLKSYERQVVADVLNAVREYEQSLISFNLMRTKVLSESRKIRDSAYERFRQGLEGASDYFEAQQAYNEVVRQYRDILIRHRRAALDLNTAVGERVSP